MSVGALSAADCAPTHMQPLCFQLVLHDNHIRSGLQLIALGLRGVSEWQNRVAP